jgi:hypothetical protein
MSTFRGYGCCCRKLHHNPKGHLFYPSRDFVKALKTTNWRSHSRALLAGIQVIGRHKKLPTSGMDAR